MAVTSPGASALQCSVPRQACLQRSKAWYSARRADGALGAALRVASTLTALLLALLTLLVTTEPTVLALLLPLLPLLWQPRLTQRSKQPLVNYSKKAAPAGPNAPVTNRALAVGQWSWLRLPLPTRQANSPAVQRACNNSPERCLAAPCAWTHAQAFPTARDGVWTHRAQSYMHLTTTFELSNLCDYKACIVSLVLCLTFLTVHLSTLHPEHHYQAMPFLPPVPACAEQYARSAGTLQMQHASVTEESLTYTRLALLVVIAELFFLVYFDDLKARLAAKTPMILNPYDTYNTYHLVPETTRRKYITALPRGRRATNSRVRRRAAGRLAWAEAVCLRRVLGAGAKRRLGASA
jgi:hypothetical protein